MGSSLWSRKLPQRCLVSLQCNNTTAICFVISARVQAKVHFRFNSKGRAVVEAWDAVLLYCSFGVSFFHQ